MTGLSILRDTRQVFDHGPQPPQPPYKAPGPSPAGRAAAAKMVAMSNGRASLARYAAAAPLAASQAYGLGPFARTVSGSPTRRLGKLRESAEGVMTAAESAGRTGQQLLNLLVWAGGKISAEMLAFETTGADPAELSAAVERLADAGLAAGDGAGGLCLDGTVAGMSAPIGLSLNDQNAITSDVMEFVCRGVVGGKVPTRKQERIDAVTSAFADPARRPAIMAKLSVAALELIQAIADQAGPRVISAEAVGITAYGLHEAQPVRYAFQRREVKTEMAPLAELAGLGIVGIDSYERRIWIWREAWPALGRPLYREWPSVPAPGTDVLTETGLRLPPVVGLVERALRHWDASPPAVLKGGDLRLGKPVVRATAKALSSDEATLELVAATALSLGLMLPNVVAVSGRGRNRRTEQVWMADDDLRSVWVAAPAQARWLRMFADWASPMGASSYQLVANRHLVLWELGALAPGLGWVDDDEAARWIEHRHATMGVAGAVTETLADLRRLGVLSATGPAGLTELGRLALHDPAAVTEADFGSAGSAIVQADLTVVCPPDLAPDLLVRLEQIARLESDRGARVFRLDGPLVTAAVQNGTSAGELSAFLESLSSVPLADTVRRLVDDAAARADRVRVVSAATVVVFTDPVDLVTAGKIASAKLVELTPTVAVSSLPADKVRAALARKGLAPLAVSSGSGVTARRSSDDASRYEQDARRHHDLGKRYGNHAYTREAERLRTAAAAARDPASKLTVAGPIAATPTLMQEAG